MILRDAWQAAGQQQSEFFVIRCSVVVQSLGSQARATRMGPSPPVAMGIPHIIDPLMTQPEHTSFFARATSMMLLLMRLMCLQSCGVAQDEPSRDNDSTAHAARDDSRAGCVPAMSLAVSARGHALLALHRPHYHPMAMMVDPALMMSNFQEKPDKAKKERKKASCKSTHFVWVPSFYWQTKLEYV